MSSARALPRAQRRPLVHSSVVGLAIVLALSTVAKAGDVDKARKTFDEGVRLYQRGDWEGARRLFRQAEAEHHASAIVYNLALAEEKLGHPQAAVDAYEAYVAEAGDGGDLSAAAIVAIAQIKARSTKLRIDTKPSGARLFVDGAPISEAAPATILVSAGHHVVVAEGDGWRGERDVEVRGAADLLPIAIDAPPAPPPPAPAPSGAKDAPVRTPSAEEPPAPDGLVWGAEFAIVPLYLLGVTAPESSTPSNARSGSSILAGPVLEIGWALSDRFVFLGRGFAGIGPDAKPSWGFTIGPGLSFRIGSFLWLGASFIAGQFETRAHGARYGTDQVFGGSVEANVIVIKKSHGEWMAGLQPGFLLTEMRQDNTTFFFPLSFGYRAY